MFCTHNCGSTHNQNNTNNPIRACIPQGDLVPVSVQWSQFVAEELRSRPVMQGVILLLKALVREWNLLPSAISSHLITLSVISFTADLMARCCDTADAEEEGGKTHATSPDHNDEHDDSDVKKQHKGDCTLAENSRNHKSNEPLHHLQNGQSYTMGHEGEPTADGGRRPTRGKVERRHQQQNNDELDKNKQNTNTCQNYVKVNASGHTWSSGRSLAVDIADVFVKYVEYFMEGGQFHPRRTVLTPLGSIHIQNDGTDDDDDNDGGRYYCDNDGTDGDQSYDHVVNGQTSTDERCEADGHCSCDSCGGGHRQQQHNRIRRCHQHRSRYRGKSLSDLTHPSPHPHSPLWHAIDACLDKTHIDISFAHLKNTIVVNADHAGGVRGAGSSGSAATPCRYRPDNRGDRMKEKETTTREKEAFSTVETIDVLHPSSSCTIHLNNSRSTHTTAHTHRNDTSVNCNSRAAVFPNIAERCSNILTYRQHLRETYLTLARHFGNMVEPEGAEEDTKEERDTQHKEHQYQQGEEMSTPFKHPETHNRDNERTFIDHGCVATPSPSRLQHHTSHCVRPPTGKDTDITGTTRISLSKLKDKQRIYEYNKYIWMLEK